jgi:hypothetical protein
VFLLAGYLYGTRLFSFFLAKEANVIQSLQHKEKLVWRVQDSDGYFLTVSVNCDLGEFVPIDSGSMYGTTVLIEKSILFNTEQKANDAILGLKLVGYTARMGFVAVASGPEGISACILNMMRWMGGIVARLIESHDEDSIHFSGFVLQGTNNPYEQIQYTCDEQYFNIIEPTYSNIIDVRELVEEQSPF